MAFMLFSIEDAVDHKYIVNKSMSKQAKMGTLIHVMDASETSDGITVSYHVAKTKQDFTIRFDTIKQFCSWCMPSTFLAKYYDKLSYREIIRYIKMENRSFMSFQFPIILFLLIVIWGGMGALWYFNFLELMLALIIGGVLSVAVIIVVCILSSLSKNNMMERLYKKVSTVKKVNAIS